MSPKSKQKRRMVEGLGVRSRTPNPTCKQGRFGGERLPFIKHYPEAYSHILPFGTSQQSRQPRAAAVWRAVQPAKSCTTGLRFCG